ncbi:hypothetical protein PQZ42_00110 [Alphaproteobacteria bacterium]|nr:hypothetical protein [Alphaproteobacteria bacterium]
MKVKFLFSFCLFFLLSCSGFELVLKENSMPNLFKNKTAIIVEGKKNEKFIQELFSFLGNNQDSKYKLVTSFSEKKENRLVKKNQVAQKVDYELTANYDIYLKDKSCKIFNKKIVTKFAFVPKSFGYNFGTDRSLEKLYRGSVRKNIQNFINSAPTQEQSVCIREN